MIFLRHASSRYHAALAQIDADRAEGKMPNRPLAKDDFIKRRPLITTIPHCLTAIREKMSPFLFPVGHWQFGYTPFI